MTPPAIDPDRYAELQATAGADFVVELVDTFLQEAPLMLGELRPTPSMMPTASAVPRIRSSPTAIPSVH
jgi:hypothetical protein